MKPEELTDLLYQVLETELGGVEVYRSALKSALNEDLAQEWQEYLEQTEQHVQIVRGLFDTLGLDPELETPGRKVVRHIGQSLVKAMDMARASGPREAAELVAAECVVHAETKDHLNWELVGLLANERGGTDSKTTRDALKKAHAEVEEEEDEHLYHTTGWSRELWIQSLGLPAVLPPPEEEKDVKTAIGAARAKKARKELL